MLTLSPLTTAAKTALKRKKQHEHSLEQTQGQIGTLEAQINAIESANINKETLLAMEKASEAMKQIHGKLTPEKVDETMCVLLPTSFRLCVCLACLADHYCEPGTSYGSKTPSAKKSSTPSQATKSESLSTRKTWRPSWTSYSRSSWTSRCSRLEQCRSRIRSSECLPHPKIVSYTPRAPNLPHMLTGSNSQGQDAGCGTGGRRRGRAAKAASRNGHVRSLELHGEQIERRQATSRTCPQTDGLVAEVDREAAQGRWARITVAGSLSAAGVGVQEAAFVIARKLRRQDRGSQLYNFQIILKGLSGFLPMLDRPMEAHMWETAWVALYGTKVNLRWAAQLHGCGNPLDADVHQGVNHSEW